MKPSLLLSTLALAAGLVSAACTSNDPGSGASTPLAFDPGMCARLSACDVSGPGLLSADFGFGAFCASLWQGLQAAAMSNTGTLDRVAATQIECLARATDCAAARACQVPTPAQAAVCDAHPGELVCSGATLLDCQTADGEPPSVATDCAAAGTSCIPGAAVCGAASCNPHAAASCDGDLRVQCFGGALVSSSCVNLQSTDCSQSSESPPSPGSPVCKVTVSNTCAIFDGEALCAGSGAACDDSFVATCDGTAIVSCTAGRMARLDCAEQNPGLTCVTGDYYGPSCVLATDECSGTETCTGSVLTYCWFGKVATVDCKQYGASGCVETFNGEHNAHCVE